MKEALDFLKVLTLKIPPGPGQSHSLILNESGGLSIILMVGEQYELYNFEEADLEKPIMEAVWELVAIHEDRTE